MSERDYFEPADTSRLKYMYEEFYKTAAHELLYNSLTLANPDNSIKQPLEAEGKQTVELLIPPLEAGYEGEDRLPNWESICVVVYPEGKIVPGQGELQVSIMLTQALQDPSGEFETTALEFIEEFNIYLMNNFYHVQKVNYFFDFSDFSDPVYGFETAAETVTLDDIKRLNQLICAASVRPADF